MDTGYQWRCMLQISSVNRMVYQYSLTVHIGSQSNGTKSKTTKSYGMKYNGARFSCTMFIGTKYNGKTTTVRSPTVRSQMVQCSTRSNGTKPNSMNSNGMEYNRTKFYGKHFVCKKVVRTDPKTYSWKTEFPRAAMNPSDSSVLVVLTNIHFLCACHLHVLINYKACKKGP